jgi:hypothetical protein
MCEGSPPDDLHNDSGDNAAVTATTDGQIESEWCAKATAKRKTRLTAMHFAAKRAALSKFILTTWMWPRK